MTQSLAFWIENSSEKPKEKPLNVELHFNYWHLPDDEINYLDVGVLLMGDKQFDSINIYLPFKYEKEKYISNLGDKITSNDNLISAVFNNDVKSKSLIAHCSAQHIIFLDKKNDNEILFFTNLSCSSEDLVVINEYNDNN